MSTSLCVAKRSASEALLLRYSGAAGVLLLIGVYAFDTGHGFVKDDFNWILTSRVEHVNDLSRLLGAATGFFRPLVSLSFAIDYALFDLRPLGYGLTNLVLLLACVGVLCLLLRACGIGREVAGRVALLWALNFQGINMAVLWISGRTALLVTLFAVAAAWAWTRNHRVPASLLAMAAMWSKEEAFVLPAILTAWSLIDARHEDPAAPGLSDVGRALSGPPMARVVHRTWPLWLVAAVSLVCRTWSGAFTPGSAPEFYRYQFDLAMLGANALAYADRAATTPVVTLMVFWLAGGVPRLGGSTHTAALENARSRDRAYKGAIWLLLSLAPTILLPVRSSLYTVLPSVGVMLIVGDLAERMVRHATPAALRRATVVLMVLFVALVPVYRSRNTRYVKEAELSAAIVNELSGIAMAHPNGGLVVIKDVRDARPTAEQAFGPLADRAALLVTNGKLQVWIDPAPAELAGAATPDVRSAIGTLVVEKGAVRRIQ
jgi:hypothetical protein